MKYRKKLIYGGALVLAGLTMVEIIPQWGYLLAVIAALVPFLKIPGKLKDTFQDALPESPDRAEEAKERLEEQLEENKDEAKDAGAPSLDQLNRELDALRRSRENSDL